MNYNGEKIDFVVTWVDGNDPVWKKEHRRWKKMCENDMDARKTQECETIDGREERYRDYGLMRYWFRGVEQFAPWVNKIYFITYGHLPEWLNTKHPKLKIIRHEDYIPKQNLPIFNSNAIELGMHRIEGLSDKFVYFNDDFFPVRPLNPEDFFRNGLPCDMLAFQPVVANPENPVMSHMFLNNTLILSKYFNKRKNVKKQPGKYFKLGYPLMYFGYNFLELAFPKFTGFYTVHGPFPFLKQTFEQVWDKEAKALEETISHKFRSKDDLCLYLLRDWQKLTGQFVPKNLHRDFAYYELAEDNNKLLAQIRSPKKKIICINDANQSIDFDTTKAQLQQAFEILLPCKSAFEKRVE